MWHVIRVRGVHRVRGVEKKFNVQPHASQEIESLGLTPSFTRDEMYLVPTGARDPNPHEVFNKSGLSVSELRGEKKNRGKTRGKK